MHVNLELLVNGKFVVFGMVKVLVTIKSSYAKACYLIQKLECAIERVYLLQCFCFKIWLAEDVKVLKISVPYAIHFFGCVWYVFRLKHSCLQQVKLSKKKFVAKTLGQIHPSNNRFKFLCSSKLTIVSYTTNF